MNTVLNLPFAGDTSTWALISKAKKVKFEAHGPYQRRTYRTRTTILSPSGPLDVSIPVQTGHSLMYKDALLNYETDWDRQLLYALKTAYNSSPFYEFMQDDISAVFGKRHKFLWDLNMDLFETVARLINIPIDVSETTEFCKVGQDEKDYRIAIEPKYAHILHNDSHPVTYHQVFSQPYIDRPFTPYLSVLDLIFNMGCESRDVLRHMAL